MIKQCLFLAMKGTRVCASIGDVCHATTEEENSTIGASEISTQATCFVIRAKRL
jgi:hypothetical protein